jgi:hypothetical protein
MKGIICLILGLGIILIQPLKGQNQDRDWPIDTVSKYNSCQFDYDSIEIELEPDSWARPMNKDKFSKLVADTPEITIMRDAGILSCLVKAKILVNKDGKYVCHVLNSNCHPYWDRAIIRYLHVLAFKPGQKEDNPVNSWITLPFNWIFEW